MRYPAISATRPLVLASASPRRKRLLRQIGIPFRALKSHVEEDDWTGGDSLAGARLLAERKARAVTRRAGSLWILGADTMVVSGKKVLGKPADPEEARAMLSLLCGRKHRVITGFCLLNPDLEVAGSEAVSTEVKFKDLTKEEISAYVATGEPFGKAGSYAIQGIGAFLVESISGSYTNVVGLPVCALVKTLISIGALKSFPSPP